MNNEDKLFDFMTKIYAEMKEGFKKIDERFEKVDERLNNIEKTVLRIESEHGEKLSALFDGYKQLTDKVDRIEAEVIKHDEFILKRVR